METYTLEHNAGSFQLTEDLKIKNLTGLDLETFGWTLNDNDDQETNFELYIYANRKTNSKIQLNVIAENGEAVDGGYQFYFIEAIQDLIRHGYLMIANDNGDEAENGTLQIKP